jgi:AcrR family transcriptional regulator
MDYFPVERDVLSEEKQQTKDRLLDAAEQLFANKGFENVSIRELASEADVNIAAINYHFQGKENLFREVILRRFVAQRDSTLAALDKILVSTQGKPSLDDVVGTMVGQYLENALAHAGSGNFMNLMVREMHENKGHASSAFFKEMVAPVFMAFSRALITARPRLEQEELNWIIASIVGQIHHFIMRWHKAQSVSDDDESRQIMLRAFPALSLERDQYIEQVSFHITRFSTAAIDSMFPEVSP